MPVDCDGCMTPGDPFYNDEATRRSLHCGWMGQDQWTGAGPRGEKYDYGSITYDLDVCPGWLVRLPAVTEARDACDALRASHLDLYFPHNENPVLQAAMLLDSAWKKFEADEARRREEQAERDRLSMQTRHV